MNTQIFICGKSFIKLFIGQSFIKLFIGQSFIKLFIALATVIAIAPAARADWGGRFFAPGAESA